MSGNQSVFQSNQQGEQFSQIQAKLQQDEMAFIMVVLYLLSCSTAQLFDVLGKLSCLKKTLSFPSEVLEGIICACLFHFDLLKIGCFL